MASPHKVIPHLGTILIISIIYVQGSGEEKLCILQTLSYINMKSPPLCIERLVNYQVLMRSAENRCFRRNDAYKNMQAFETVRKKDSKCPEINQRSYNAINYACCNYENDSSYVPYQCTFLEDYQMSRKCNSITELERHRTSMSFSCYVRSYKHPNVIVPNLMVTNDGCRKNKYKLIKTACCINARYARDISTLLPLTEITTRQTWRTYTISTTSTKSQMTSSTTSRHQNALLARSSSSSTPTTKEPNDNTPAEKTEMTADTVFGVAFTVIVFLLLIGITVFIVIKKRKRNRNKPVKIDYSKHDFAVKRNESKIMEPENMYDEILDFEESCHTLGNRSCGRSSRHAIHGHAADRCGSRHDMNQRPSRHDIDRYDTDRRASRHDMGRRTSRHDLGRQVSSRRSRHDMERNGPHAEATTANPLEMLASVLMLGEQLSNQRSKNRQKDDDSIAPYTDVGSQRNKSTRSKRKSKRRRDDNDDDNFTDKSVTETAKRRKSSRKERL